MGRNQRGRAMTQDESGLRPRRSLLYVPASNPRALEKALGLESDGVILDLEDSVAPEAKAGARAQPGFVLRHRAASLVSAHGVL